MATEAHKDAPWRDMANKGKNNSTYTEGGASHAKLTQLASKLAKKNPSFDEQASNRRNKAVDVGMEREFKKRGWKMSTSTSNKYSQTDPKTKVSYRPS